MDEWMVFSVFSTLQVDTEKQRAFSSDKNILSLDLAEPLPPLHRASASLPAQRQGWVL